MGTVYAILAVALVASSVVALETAREQLSSDAEVRRLDEIRLASDNLMLQLEYGRDDKDKEASLVRLKERLRAPFTRPATFGDALRGLWREVVPMWALSAALALLALGSFVHRRRPVRPRILLEMTVGAFVFAGLFAIIGLVGTIQSLL